MNIIIAGGGTGGHLYPGIAIGEAARSKGHNVTFVGTAKGIEVRAVPKAGFPLELLKVSGIKGLGVVAKLSSLSRLPVAGLASVSLVRRLKADAVIGVGGYASGPLVLAAACLGVPSAVCEQNSVPGITNRILGRVVRRIYTMFPSSTAYFPTRKVTQVGNPVRASFIEAAAGTVDRPSGQIFVFGGSQGARPLNKSVPALLRQYADEGAESFSVLHQTGKADHDEVKQAYDGAPFEVSVVPFIDDMVEAYRQARVVICRAGATSCAELCVLGVPSILVPFPHATDDHQTKNAKDLETAGAAFLLPQDRIETELVNMVDKLLGEDEFWDTMAQKASGLGRAEAANDIVMGAENRFSLEVGT